MADETSRSTLRTLLRAAGDGAPPLDAIAHYALAQNSEAGLSGFERLVFQAAGECADADVVSYLFDVEEGRRDLLRAYGGLSAAQRTALERGGTVPFAALAPSAKADLESLTFRRASELREPLGGHESPDATFLADGLAPDAPLRFADVQTELTTAYRHRGALRLMGVSGVGYVLENQETENSLGVQQGYPPVATTRFVPGVRRQFAFVFLLTPAAEYRGYLRDVRLDPSGRAYLPTELPPTHLKEFRRVYDYYRANRRGG